MECWFYVKKKRTKIRLWKDILLIFAVFRKLVWNVIGLERLGMVLNFFGLGEPEADNGVGVVVTNWLVEVVDVERYRGRVMRVVLSKMVFGS